MKTFDATPRASMLIESMRDIGYSLETALADIVDNSITAKASNIHILADTGQPDARIGILDDGTGMTEGELQAAMRPGSRNPLDERDLSDLGRFGLGLKTASFSQCRRLTVVTRRNGITSAAIWDLDLVAKDDDWLVWIPEEPTAVPWANRIGESGTLVLWELLDRAIEQDDTGRGLSRLVIRIDEAREHLALVFHRFLSGEPGLRKVRILLNERPLEPFDPFHSRHPATVPGPVEKIRVGTHEVIVQTFTLPHHRKVTPVEWEHHAGRAGYLRNQGFYVYREKRLIIHGTWFGLARQTELTKLARVRIDMPNGLDEEWKIDVRKASAQPPHQVRERLRRIIETIGATSKRVYTSRGKKLVTDSRLPVWNRVQDKNEISYRINDDHPVLADFIERLPDDLERDFHRVVELVGSTLPTDALFADLGGNPENLAANTISEETLRHTVSATFRKLEDAGVQFGELSEMLKLTEPFRSNWQLVEIILGEIAREESLSG